MENIKSSHKINQVSVREGQTFVANGQKGFRLLVNHAMAEIKSLVLGQGNPRIATTSIELYFDWLSAVRLE